MIILGLLFLVLGACQILEYYFRSPEAHCLYLGIVLVGGGIAISIASL